MESNNGDNREVVKYKVTIKARNLAKMDKFGKSDPFFTVSKSVLGKSVGEPVYTAEVIMNDLNPHWKPFEISVNGRETLILEIYDFDTLSKNDFIGSYEFVAGFFIGSVQLQSQVQLDEEEENRDLESESYDLTDNNGKKVGEILFQVELSQSER